MMAVSLSLALSLLLAEVQLAMGHALWQYPLPRYDNDDQLKAYPCGPSPANDYNSGSTPVTQLSPGATLLFFRVTFSAFFQAG